MSFFASRLTLQPFVSNDNYDGVVRGLLFHSAEIYAARNLVGAIRAYVGASEFDWETETTAIEEAIVAFRLPAFEEARRRGGHLLLPTFGVRISLRLNGREIYLYFSYGRAGVDHIGGLAQRLTNEVAVSTDLMRLWTLLD